MLYIVLCIFYSLFSKYKYKTKIKSPFLFLDNRKSKGKGEGRDSPYNKSCTCPSVENKFFNRID